MGSSGHNFVAFFWRMDPDALNSTTEDSKYLFQKGRVRINWEACMRDVHKTSRWMIVKMAYKHTTLFTVESRHLGYWDVRPLRLARWAKIFGRKESHESQGLKTGKRCADDSDSVTRAHVWERARRYKQVIRGQRSVLPSRGFVHNPRRENQRLSIKNYMIKPFTKKEQLLSHWQCRNRPTAQKISPCLGHRCPSTRCAYETWLKWHSHTSVRNFTWF